MDKVMKNKRGLELVTSRSSGKRYSSEKFFYLCITCPIKSGKCGKELKKLQKFEYLEKKKSFFDEIKNIFQFLKGYHLVKK